MVIGVTGASGHIGNLLCQELIKQGFTVRALMRTESRLLSNKGVEVIIGDICNPDTLPIFAKSCDILIHAAALIDLGYHFDQRIYDTNVTGTKNILEAARQAVVKKVICFSSIHAFSHAPFDEPLDEQRLLVGDKAVFYDRTKRDAMRLALSAAENGQQVCVLCPTGVIGPPDHRPSKLGKAIIDIYNGSVPAVIKGGFDFVDVRDIVAGTIKAIDHGRSGEVYILSGHYLTIRELSALVLSARGTKKKLVELPMFIADLFLPFVKLYAQITGKEPLYDRPYLDILRFSNRRISAAKATHDFGYQSRPMTETIQDIIDWFRKNNKL
jgi:dihydroflavonol-4-reductase